MKKLFAILVIFLVGALIPTYVFATLIEVTAINSTRAATTETAYINDASQTPDHHGDFLGVFEGNDSNQLGDIADWLITYGTGYASDFELYETASKDMDSSAATYGTWDVDPAVSLYVVKAGNYLALYELNPALSSINWNTYELWIRDATGGSSTGIEVSHLSGYNPSPVPEPATMVLFGLGLLGMAGLGRKTRKK